MPLSSNCVEIALSLCMPFTTYAPVSKVTLERKIVMFISKTIIVNAMYILLSTMNYLFKKLGVQPIIVIAG